MDSKNQIYPWADCTYAHIKNSSEAELKVTTEFGKYLCQVSSNPRL